VEEATIHQRLEVCIGLDVIAGVRELANGSD
jgi:hypothetical protein